MTERDPARELSTHGRERPLVYEWVGEPVFLRYAHNTASSGDMLKLAKGEVQARRGIFVLREVSTLGVVVRRILSREPRKVADPLFIPWSAVHAIQGLPKDEDE